MGTTPGYRRGVTALPPASAYGLPVAARRAGDWLAWPIVHGLRPLRSIKTTCMPGCRMREAHAKCVKSSPPSDGVVVDSLGFWGKVALAPSLLSKMANRVDSVDGPSKVRGLFAKITIRNQKSL